MQQFKFMDLLDEWEKDGEAPAPTAGLPALSDAAADVAGLGVMNESLPLDFSQARIVLTEYDISGIEQARYVLRTRRFITRGVEPGAAQAVAYRLIERDRERDDRRSCAECRHQADERCVRGLYPIGGFDIEILHRCKGFRE